ncbi:unnamed protein product [Mycena citricolor]|uniref:Cyanovirin-N domain-containing protein n=1 Tax=Mycena citricolor TaxID=2018698 RepID=A0AAD2H941_9AGAR|nr:unnamed protein product [Mycena citricolor]
MMKSSFSTFTAATLILAAGQAHASSYSIAYFSDGNCQSLLGSSSGTFTSNGCLSGGSLSGVNSIRFNSLSDANIHTWAPANCNHNEWAVPVTCNTANACISAPGTNSIGFQIGCR